MTKLRLGGQFIRREGGGRDAWVGIGCMFAAVEMLCCGLTPRPISLQ